MEEEKQETVIKAENPHQRLWPGPRDFRSQF